MRRALIVLALLAAFTLRGQDEEERLWMPEGYRLMSLEERKALPEDEMRAIGTRNTELLREAARSMTPAQRQELGLRLGQFAQTHELAQYERQYVTMVSMMLLAAGQEERTLADRSAAESRFQAFLREQETTTKGFPAGREPVEAEADAIEAQLGKTDSRTLYLRALKPLRARPWNEAIRVCFRKLVRGDSYPRQQKTSLYDAALVFVQARQKESPNEGAWYSLEAFLRLSMRNEVADAKRLFAIAIQKNANDTESRIFPILLAEIDGDQKEVERLLPRAREAWPKQEDLDRNLWSDIDVLPSELQPRAREAVGGKYKKAHPADWSSRAEILSASVAKGNFREVETETATLLGLPMAILPEPHRTEFLALRLRATAGLGRCDEVLAEVPRFEAAVRTIYPSGFDSQAPPAPRTARDVQALRSTLEEGRRALRKLQASIADGSLDSSPEWSDVPRQERVAQATEWAAELEEELKEMESLLADSDDVAVAARWSLREHEAWQELRRVPDNAIFDEADRGTRLTILVRSAAGKCLLAQHRVADAARVLAPCVGSGPNYHGDCGEPILEAGRELVKQGKLKEAAAVYTVTAPVENFSTRAEDLYVEIEKAAPGTVVRFQPTPRPTPKAPVTPLGIP
jgi:hypothetical protein